MKPTFEPSPMPTQTMNSGSIASGGIGRSSSTTGSTTLRTARTWPASSPSASASTAPAEKPTATRSSVAATCTQSWPLRASSSRAPITTHGAGRNKGLKGFVSSTRPPATLHRARNTASNQEVLERAEIVRTCLPASPDVEALYLDAGGLVERAKPGTILIDLSSVLPSTPRKIEPRAKQRGVHFLEAPVSGGVSGAKAATLAVMVGGDAAVLERARPVLRAIGPNIFSVGPVGAGNTVKAINNMMACVNSLAMMEGLVLGRRAGLDPMTIYEVVKASSGGSKALERIPTAIVPRNFAPGFKVALMNKDLETFNTIAKELHVPVSFSNVAQRYQQAAMAAGLADQDTSVALTIIEKLAALE